MSDNKEMLKGQQAPDAAVKKVTLQQQFDKVKMLGVEKDEAVLEIQRSFIRMAARALRKDELDASFLK